MNSVKDLDSYLQLAFLKSCYTFYSDHYFLISCFIFSARIGLLLRVKLLDMHFYQNIYIFKWKLLLTLLMSSRWRKRCFVLFCFLGHLHIRSSPQNSISSLQSTFWKHIWSYLCIWWFLSHWVDLISDRSTCLSFSLCLLLTGIVLDLLTMSDDIHVGLLQDPFTIPQLC